jgi:tetratricopeptide (TPR) repeat protein
MSALVQVVFTLGIIAGSPETTPNEPREPMPPQASAEALFHEGLKAYDAHDYGVALRLFQDAYSQSHEPEILFDIGQTFRALGNCKQAIAHFDAFIAAVPPDDPLLPRVRSRRANLLSCGQATAVSPPQAPAEPIDQLQPSLTAVPQLRPPPERAVAAEIQLTPARPARDHGGLRTACIASATGTLAFALAGSILGIEAYSTAQTVDLSTVWDQSAARADERGSTLGQIATTLFISAGAAAGVAAVTCALDRWRH